MVCRHQQVRLSVSVGCSLLISISGRKVKLSLVGEAEEGKSERREVRDGVRGGWREKQIPEILCLLELFKGTFLHSLTVNLGY